MKRKNIFYLLLYLISFIITSLCFIFWLNKNEFDLEFREKETTTAIIYNIDSEELIEELYDGKKTIVHNVNYIEYSYSVNGKKYNYGSKYHNGNYSKSDKIQIEYVKNNPSLSKLKGKNDYSHNFFIRNLIPVSAVSLLLMFFLFSLQDSLTKLKSTKPNMIK